MRISKGLGRLLLTTAAMPVLWAAPASAQSADATPAANAVEAAPTPDLTIITVAMPKEDDRLVALGHGLIRPFGGGILPNSGMIRTFAGPISGSSGMIRTFQGDVTGASGMIRTFSGDATASSGMIRTFSGMIRTFGDNLRGSQMATMPATGPDSVFWGGLYPASGSLTASSGMIRTFSGQFEATSGMIRTFSGMIRTFDGPLLTYDQAPTVYDGMTAKIADMVANSKASFGAAVTARTGQTFEAGFSNRMLAKYGIDLNDPRSVAGMDEFGIEVFLVDYYDNLMQFSGVDQVDHWMKAVNWTPRITQDLGSGKDSKIGLLDFTVTGEGTSNIVQSGGVSTVSGGHGSAVLSLISAAHDGRGVMGIAPGAAVVTYNPFDATYTAGWADIKNGVDTLVKSGATIINMSLGVPDWTLNAGWNDVFKNSTVQSETRKRVFVLAAGNDGITQTQNVTWAFDKNPSIIVVGSVDPSGKISDFSNRPGDVCLTQDGKIPGGGGGCNDNSHQKLMTRFIVAPGEWMLVSDGAGGVTRMSGTSFAAPLVSGTVALIHDRWPWLSDRPKDVAEIILGSARDVGDPGTDAVYGRGMLDVTAAMSPKNMSGLTWKISINGSGLSDLKVGAITTAQRAAMVTNWEATNAYVSVFENTLSDKRDFIIPLSTKLAGQTVGSAREQYMSYLTSRFLDWFKAGQQSSGFAGGSTSAAFGSARYTSSMAAPGGLQATMSAAPKAYRPGFRQDGVPFESGVALRDADGAYAVRFGTGRGGAALGAQGFGMQSDYEVATGGANPFLGFASGAGYAAVDVAVASNLTLSTGFARQNAVRDLRWMGMEERAGLGRAEDYRASANTVTMQYRAAPWLTTTLGYTLLNEESGLLGTQSLDRNDLHNGSRSDAGTMTADIALGRSLSVSGSATLGRTRAGDVARQGIAVSDGGLLSSAFQGAVTKVGLFGNDRLRVSVSQPLHLERGAIEVSNVQVIDRQTGEVGTVVQSFNLQGKERHLLGELLYGRSLMGGAAEMNLFGRANLGGATQAGQASLTLGSSFRLGF